MLVCGYNVPFLTCKYADLKIPHCVLEKDDKTITLAYYQQKSTVTIKTIIKYNRDCIRFLAKYKPTTSFSRGDL